MKVKARYWCIAGTDQIERVIIAMYRIIEEGWSKDEAINELINGGYGHHAIYKNIPEYIKNVSIEKISKRVKARKEIAVRR